VERLEFYEDNALSSRLKIFPFISVCFLQVTTNHLNLNIWNANARRILGTVV
jgi:hypothetical protein